MIGTRLADRYELLEKLGAGGMGVVYRARDPWLERDVAVKMVPPSRLDEHNEERFRREARLVAQMDHPAIVPIHDFGRHDGSLFIVMPLVEGTTLRRLIEERGLAADDAVAIAAEVAEALAHSHARGVIHRDVKPENVMVSRENGTLRARVMDFGLAHSDADRRLSQAGGMAGTPAYLSPEQLAGEPLDARTDIYSLGVVLYECLAGVPPFDGPIPTLIYRVGHDPPPPFARHGVEVAEDLERAVLRCLAKRPAERPADARELAAALRRSVAGEAPSGDAGDLAPRPPPAAAPAPLVGRREEWARLRQRLDAAVAGECQLVLIAGEVGVGKSRLLQELEELAGARGVRVLRGRYSDLEESFQYEGLCELIQDFFRRTGSDTSQAGAGAGPDFSDLAPELLAISPVLSEVGELRRAAGDAAPSPARETAPHGSVYVFELLARTFIRLADGRPLVLTLENLHAADASIEALRYFVHRLAPTPTLIVGTYRSGEIDRGHPLLRLVRGLADHPRLTALSLEPLSPAELRQLAEHMIGSPRLRHELVERLYEASEGNPLFARELLRSLLETGGVTRDASGFWSLSGEVALTARDALPATLQQAVERRVENLPEDQQDVLAVASVLGKAFDARDLEAVLAESLGGDELDTVLDELVERGLLREDRDARGDRLVFASGLVRAVLYRDLPRRRRRLLHRRFARHLETRLTRRTADRRPPDRPERFYPQLVHHFSAGDVPAKTVEYALAQARWSLSARNPDDAVRAARVGLEFVQEEEVARPLEVRGELFTLLARAHRALGDNGHALEEAGRAVAALRQANATGPAAGAAWLAAQAAWQGRRIDDTRLWVDQCADLARAAVAAAADTVAGATSSGGKLLAADVLQRVLRLGATVANLHGDHELARRYRDEARELEPAEDDEERTTPAGGEGGTLRAALPVAIHHLDPAELASDEEGEVAMNVFETLLRIDPDGHLASGLAREWESEADGRRFVLALRPGVRFADGEPLTAAAVRASFERLARHRIDAPPPALAAVAGREAFVAGDSPSLAGVEAAGDDRLVFHLAEPLPIFPVLLTDPYTAVVRAKGADDTELAGTGPFQLREIAGDRVLLERNPAYRGRPARVDRIEFRTSVEAHDIAEGLRAGNLDLGRDLLLEDLEELLRDPWFRNGLVEATRKNVHFLLWNQEGPVSRNVDLRRALSGSLDTSGLVWRTLGRFAQPAVCLVPPGVLGHDPGRRLRALPPERVHELLEASGLEPPIRLRVLASPVIFNRGRGLLGALFAEWSTLGVEVECEERPLDDFLEAYQEHRDVDLLIARWNGDYDDPDTFTYALFHSRHGLLRRYYSSAAADRLLDRARQETEAAARLELYQRFESLLERDAAVVPLFHDVAYRVAGPQLANVRLGTHPPYVSYACAGKIDGDAEGRRPQASWSLERGELHVPVVPPVASLDPMGAGYAEHFEVTSTLFETLTRFDEHAAIVPWLAASLTTSDARRYHLRLRDDVRFHDGRRLTARDVRYSFERALRQPARGLQLVFLPIRGARALSEGEASELAGLEIVSTHELVIELEAPLPFFPELLAYPAAAIVAEGAELFAGSWRDGCVGTGPFRLLRFAAGVDVELERHPQYWRPGFPRSERLAFHFGRDPERVAADFRDGRYSLATDLRPADVAELRRDPDLARGYLESPRLSTLFLVFNSRRGPLADARLRRSLAGALDVDGLLRDAEPLAAKRAQGLVPPGLLGYEEPRRRAAEAEEARELAGGALAGLRLGVAVIPRYLGQYASLWDALQRAFKRLGVEAEVREAPITGAASAAMEGRPDVLCYRWLADYPDPDSFAAGLLHSRTGVFSGMLGDPEIDRLCERGRQELDPALRHAIYRELEEILAREALIVPLLHEQSHRFCHPSIECPRVYFGLPEIRYDEIRVRR